jgi:dipeptidyl aminopeptidase/acylaminoacyl peptidase
MLFQTTVSARLLAVLLLARLAGGAPAPEGDWEQFPDGSSGQVTEFQGVGGLSIPAYVRKPAGPGPFPVIVLMHGGKYGKPATVGMGRVVKSPTEYFIKAGYVVYAADYRPAEKIAVVPIEFDDTVEAVKTARKLPFVDPTRVGVMGGSHGGQVLARVISRIDTKGAVLCAPAALDLIEDKKAFGRGEKLVQVLMTMIRDLEAKYGATLEEVEKDPAKYGYNSALSEVAQVRCPILIVNGQDDDNSPPSIVDVYVKKLRAAGKQVDTYLPEHGHHGFYFGHPDVPETQESSRRAVAFFQKQFVTTQYKYGSLDWVDTDKSEPEGMHYKTFHSKIINADVSYMVYLPPDYEQQPTQRYPVLYDLHASGGTPKRDGAEIARRFGAAIRAKTIPPMIIVFPNGLRGNTMYSDSKDGQYPVETVIIKDLIPHIDSTYRTIASREGRALDGFSMGGFGAAHFGFKYPETFSVISIMAPPLLGPDVKGATPQRAWSNLFPTAMGGDMAYFEENDPFALVAKNAGALRDRTAIRLVCHVESENWLGPQCEKLHELLYQYKIPHAFYFLSNVKSHNRGQCLETMGDAGLMFFGSSFKQLWTASFRKRL